MKDSTAPDAVSEGFPALLAAGILLLGNGVPERRGDAAGFAIRSSDRETSVGE